jgi:nucleotide-binding universal stress UspA family protein
MLHCTRPILAVPRYCAFPDKTLLAYDGSPKSEEALFVAAYLAEKHRTPLSVLTVLQAGQVTEAVVDHARQYLALHEVEAAFEVREGGEAAEAILNAARTRQSGMIVTGSYGAHPMVEVMLGSTVDRVLREASQPVLICR